MEKAGRLLKEIKNLVVTFFRPCRMLDEIFELPKNVRNLGIRKNSLFLLSTVIALVFSFMLKATNMLITHKFIMLGIVVFMLYRGQQLLSQSLNLFIDSEEAKFNLIFKDEITFRGSTIIGKVANRVSKYDSKNKLYRIMDNESILNSIKRYLETFWVVKTSHMFEIADACSVVVMLIFAIITNNTISQKLFIPLILFFVFISFISSAYIDMKRDEFYEKNRKLDDEQSVIVNDLLRVPSIVKQDLEMRISRFQKSLVKSNKNTKEFHKNGLLDLFNISPIFLSNLPLNRFDI